MLVFFKKYLLFNNLIIIIILLLWYYCDFLYPCYELRFLRGILWGVCVCMCVCVSGDPLCFLWGIWTAARPCVLWYT